MTRSSASELSEEGAVSAKAGQEVVDVDVTRFRPHLIYGHPPCFRDFLGVSDVWCNLFSEVVEVVFSYGETLVRDGYYPIEVDAGFFIGFSDGAVDVGFAAILVALGEGPFLRLSAADQQNGVVRANTDAAIDLFSVCFVATEGLGEDG